MDTYDELLMSMGMLQKHENPFDRDMSDRPLLNLVIHSNSMGDNVLEEENPEHRLVMLGSLDEIHMMALPAQNPQVTSFYSKNGLVTSEYCERGSQIVLRASNGTDYGALCDRGENPFSPLMGGSAVTIKDLAASSRCDYLIVGSQDPTIKRHQIRPSIITSDKGLEIIRILFVNLGLFYVRPRMKATESHYYYYRYEKLFPVCQRALSIAAVTKKDGLSENIYNHLDSLAGRLEFLCRAHDKISYFTLKTASHDTQKNALYHLSFYVMLITGIFDTIAHIATGFYQLDIRNRLDISLQIPQNKQSTPFYKQLKGKNQDLHDYLTNKDVQKCIKAFYPIRDTLQHRELPKGAAYSCNSPEKMNIYRLSKDAADSLMMVPAVSDLSLIHI